MAENFIHPPISWLIVDPYPHTHTLTLSHYIHLRSRKNLCDFTRYNNYSRVSHFYYILDHFLSWRIWNNNERSCRLHMCYWEVIIDSVEHTTGEFHFIIKLLHWMQITSNAIYYLRLVWLNRKSATEKYYENSFFK